MTVAPSITTVLNGVGSTGIRSETDPVTGSVAFHSVIEIGGAAASGANPIPVSDATTESALGIANGFLASIAGNIGSAIGAATANLQTAGNTLLTTISGYLSTLASASASQATTALQTTGNVTLVSILTALGSTSTAALQTAANAVLTSISGYLSTLAGAVSSGRVLTVDGSLTSYGTYTVTVGTSAQTLAQLLAQASTISPGGTVGAVSGIPPGARVVWLQVPSTSNAGVNFVAGGAPTAAIGMEIQTGEAWMINTDITLVQVISGSTSTLTLWFQG